MTLSELKNWLDTLDEEQKTFDKEQEIFEQAKLRANQTGKPVVVRYSQDSAPETIYPDAEPF